MKKNLINIKYVWWCNDHNFIHPHFYQFSWPGQSFILFVQEIAASTEEAIFKIFLYVDASRIAFILFFFILCQFAAHQICIRLVEIPIVICIVGDNFISFCEFSLNSNKTVKKDKYSLYSIDSWYEHEHFIIHTIFYIRTARRGYPKRKQVSNDKKESKTCIANNGVCNDRKGTKARNWNNICE